MRIDYLADHPDAVSLLAGWHHAEWGTLLAGWTLGDAVAELATHIGRLQIPTTLVALDGERAVGSASLLAADLEGWEHLSPWVASVYVVPELRGCGVGRRLVARAVGAAAALRLPAVYLWTAGQEGYYARLGWEPLGAADCHGRPVVILRLETGVAPPHGP